MKGIKHFLHKKQLMDQGPSDKRQNTEGKHEWLGVHKQGITASHLNNTTLKEHQMKKDQATAERNKRKAVVLIRHGAKL